MAKDRFGYGTYQLQEAWDYTSDNAPIFHHDYTQTSGGYEMLESIMNDVIKNYGLNSWKKFAKTYELMLRNKQEGPGEFLFERLNQSFPNLYSEEEIGSIDYEELSRKYPSVFNEKTSKLFRGK